MATMSAVTNSTIVHSIVTNLYTKFTASLNSSWKSHVYTGYPGTSVDFPVIIITHAGTRDEFVSLGTEYKRMFVTIRIEVWSKSTKERDQIWDDIYDVLRTNYIGTDSFTSVKMFNMILLSCMNIDTDASKARGGIHRKIADIQLTVYAA